MKKIAIITLDDLNNYGNRLQNYAVQEILESEINNVETVTIRNEIKGNIIIKIIKKVIKKIVKPVMKNIKPTWYYVSKINCNKDRIKRFMEFDGFIHKSVKVENAYRPSKGLDDSYDYFIVGSDQVWNPNIVETSSLFLLKFVKDNKKKIAFSASFAVNSIEKKKEREYIGALNKFKSISVRESTGKKLIKDLTGRDDAIVLLDPTMLLPMDKWLPLIKKPRQIVEFCKSNEKFILNYFLGTQTFSGKVKENIETIAKENNCKIINILDKNDLFYSCGPSEFLWLEQNAFLICTDSFHSSVFAILFDTPFVVFNRNDGQSGISNMNSRLDTLLKKFSLEHRYYKGGEISPKLLEVDYKEKNKVLKEEREKAEKFLRKALDIKYVERGRENG